MLRRRRRLDRVERATERFALPEAIYRSCPWQPREPIEVGLRQWLRCAGAALRHHEMIGMPSRAVDEAWHGFILCTARYQTFCHEAYGEFLHHYPEGEVPRSAVATTTRAEQLAGTVVAWSLVARPGEQCVLWDLDTAVGVPDPWGIPTQRVRELEHAITTHLTP